MGFSDFENLVDLDAYHDLDSTSELTESGVKEYVTMLEEGDYDDAYKDLLLCLLKRISSNIKSPGKRRREEEEEGGEEENNVGRHEPLEINEEWDKDLNYKAFLENLRCHEKSYVAKIEEDGLPLDLKYEGRESSDEEYGYKRKTRSARKKHKGPSNGSQSTYLSKETENLGRRKSGTEVERENLISDEECDYKRKLRTARRKRNEPSNGSQSTYVNKGPENLSKRKSSTKGKSDNLISGEESDYKAKLRCARKTYNGPSNGSRSTYVSKKAEKLSQKKSREKVKSEDLIPYEIVEDPHYTAFLQGSKIVGDQHVYGDGHNTNDGESGPKVEEQDDEWAPYVEILDRATFYKNFEFRHQLIAVLGKPYDKNEYKRLLKLFGKPKKALRHIDLRYGRERWLEIDDFGKTYLDYYPDLSEQLSQPCCDDEPKRLNLLRGFFFWLEKRSQRDSFPPWKDAECLAIIPEL